MSGIVCYRCDQEYTAGECGCRDGITLVHDDCRNILPLLEPGSVDLVCTDPPYGIGFMGKEFDTFKPGYRADNWKGYDDQPKTTAALHAGKYDRSTAANLAFQVWCTEMFTAILPACKPGAMLASFGGTRTYHRLTCGIEDAGWEIRDCMMWLYGCLSEDTEVLTPDGWERYNTANEKAILTYDVQADVFAWEVPRWWSTYRVESDTAYRVQSDSTDQIVSRNHRCLVERGGSLAFVAAEECLGMERMPTLSGDLHWLPQTQAAVLQQEVQRLLPRARLGQVRIQGGGSGYARRKSIDCSEDDRSQQSSVEGRPDLLQAEGQVCQPVDQVRSMPAGVCLYGSERWLRDGTSVASSEGNRASADQERMRPSRQPRRNGQQNRESLAVHLERRPQAARARTSYHATLATITPFIYTGVIFCPTVSTGAFVARRNGKVFITGNSGFPKSLDISKAIDKAAGAEREEGALRTDGRGKWELKMQREQGDTGVGHADGSKQTYHETAPATPAAKQWEGYGTALKPAWESIVLAMKPLDGTFAENALTHGVAGINVDGCRIHTAGSEAREYKVKRLKPGATLNKTSGNWRPEDGPEYIGQTQAGRWPANLILQHHPECVQVGVKKVKGAPHLGQKNPELTKQYGGGCFGGGQVTPEGGYADADGLEEVEAWECADGCPVKMLDEQSGRLQSGKMKAGTRRTAQDEPGSFCYGTYGGNATNSDTPGDTGTASRFFYCVKASGKGRGNLPAEELPLFGMGKPEFRNTHPTVKPLELMRYLLTLLYPPYPTAVCLDPFAGSGTTGVAAKQMGRKAILIECEEEYCAITACRLDQEVLF